MESEEGSLHRKMPLVRETEMVLQERKTSRRTCVGIGVEPSRHECFSKDKPVTYGTTFGLMYKILGGGGVDQQRATDLIRLVTCRCM